MSADRSARPRPVVNRVRTIILHQTVFNYILSVLFLSQETAKPALAEEEEEVPEELVHYFKARK